MAKFREVLDLAMAIVALLLIPYSALVLFKFVPLPPQEFVAYAACMGLSAGLFVATKQKEHQD